MSLPYGFSLLSFSPVPPPSYTDTMHVTARVSEGCDGWVIASQQAGSWASFLFYRQGSNGPRL